MRTKATGARPAGYPDANALADESRQVSLLAAMAGRVAPEGVDFQNDRHSVRASRLLQHAPDKGSRPQVDHPCDRHHINNWPGSLGGHRLTEYDGGEERKSDNPPSTPCASAMVRNRS